MGDVFMYKYYNLYLEPINSILRCIIENELLRFSY
jgi:hypothetical protein